LAELIEVERVKLADRLQDRIPRQSSQWHLSSPSAVRNRVGKPP
jgi:hypothetical protein